MVMMFDPAFWRVWLKVNYDNNDDDDMEVYLQTNMGG